MNPTFFVRTLRPACQSMRNVGMLIQKSSLVRRDFMSLVSSQHSQMVLQRARSRFTPVLRREFASSGNGFNLPSRTLSFFVLSSVGIIGCFYVISYSLQNTNIYKESEVIVNRCPEIMAITGSPAERKGLIKGKSKKGVAEMHYKMSGSDGEVMVNIRGTCEISFPMGEKIHHSNCIGKLQEGSKKDYDFETITVERRLKNEVLNMVLYENGEFKMELEDAPAMSVMSMEGEAAGTARPKKEVGHGFWLDKPWYYRIGLAVGCGMVMGIVASVMIMSSRKAPKSSSAYQSLLVLLKENKIAKDILGENVKNAGKIVGKSEESWANFSVRMEGKKSAATVNCQAFRQGDTWRFTVVSLDTKDGRVYLCK